ncbi:MAG TPA: DUF1318 domain-containing protein [Bdellovibrionota bacterium]|nr:DUF1318 domain-containing protein [Bdellovibrionota bacterium]
MRIAAGGLALLTGCVTVNVNFPEGVVQRATDDFVRDLYRAKTTDTDSTTAESPAPTTDGQKAAEKAPPANLKKKMKSEGDSSSIDLGFWINEARADDAFVVNTPAAQALKRSLKARLADVIRFKRQGFLAETKDGRLTVRPEGKASKLLAGKLESLSKQENDDRDKLYHEALGANGLGGEKLEMIKRSFANSFQAESPSGTWVEGADGTWERKP